MRSFTITATSAASLGLVLLQSASATTSYSLPILRRDKESDYIEEICFPTTTESNGTMVPDLDAPCNGIQNVLAECTYGKSYAELSNLEDSEDDPTPASNKTQQSCFCGGTGSSYWDQMSGCMNCERLHGATDGWFPTAIVSSLSSAYCSGKPTAGLADFQYEYAMTATAALEAMTASASKASDVLGGSKTAVSYYYTPATSGAHAAKTTSGGSAASVTGTPGATTTAGNATATGAAVPLRAAAGGAGVVAIVAVVLAL